MKTNQLMTVAFSSGDIEVFHKTAMGNLTQLWRTGNMMRASEGNREANITKFLESDKTKRFVAILDRQGIMAIEKTGRGKSAKTWACLELMVYAAEYLSTEFHVEVIQTFIKGKLLDFRDESGDNFKAMNIAIDSYLPGRGGRDNKGLRIQVAKQIKHKVNPELVSWNFATADDLRYRSEIEDKITTFLSMGLVDSYDHLKELISRL